MTMLGRPRPASSEIVRAVMAVVRGKDIVFPRE